MKVSPAPTVSIALTLGAAARPVSRSGHPHGPALAQGHHRSPESACDQRLCGTARLRDARHRHADELLRFNLVDDHDVREGDERFRERPGRRWVTGYGGA